MQNSTVMGFFCTNQTVFGLSIFISQIQKPLQQDAKTVSLISFVTDIHLGYPTNITLGSCIYILSFKTYTRQEKLVNLFLSP